MNTLKLCEELLNQVGAIDGYAQLSCAYPIGRLLEKHCPSHFEQLQCLVTSGPLHDGNLIGSTLRDDLVKLGLATRIVHKSQIGFNAATELGLCVYKDVTGVIGKTADEIQENKKIDGLATFKLSTSPAIEGFLKSCKSPV